MGSLLIADRYMPHNGGSRRYYHQLAQRLGPDAVVLTGPQPGDREFDRTSGVTTVRRRGIRPNYAVAADRIANPVLNLLLAYGPGMVATVFWSLVEILRRRPRVIHAAGYAFAGLAARLWAPLFGIPFVVYAHGEDVLSTSRRRLFARYMNWVYRRADAIVVNSRNTAQLVQDLGIDPALIHVACPGVDARWFPRRGETPVERPAEGPVLLTVGRLVKHKGHATVAAALPALLHRWPELTWVLVGKGPQEQALRDQVQELGIDGNVQFKSGLTDEELRNLYGGADIFVQPNGEVDGAFEGYGMVFLEAGASALPVVGGDHGGVREVIRNGETGMLVPPFDAGALAETLARLLSDDAGRLAMGQRGQVWARSRGWDDTLAPALELDRTLGAGIKGSGKLVAS